MDLVLLAPRSNHHRPILILVPTSYISAQADLGHLKTATWDAVDLDRSMQSDVARNLAGAKPGEISYQRCTRSVPLALEKIVDREAMQKPKNDTERKTWKDGLNVLVAQAMKAQGVHKRYFLSFESLGAFEMRETAATETSARDSVRWMRCYRIKKSHVFVVQKSHISVVAQGMRLLD